MNDKPVSRTGQPNIEDYATVESYCNGVPVYSFSNITYVYAISPDLLPGVVMQEGNKTSRYPPYGKSLPKEIEIKLSRDAWHWETVYESKDFSGDASGVTVIEFQPRLAKQIWIIANNFPDKAAWAGHVFSIGEVEVRGPDGKNLGLVSRGAGVTVSSVTCSHDNDRFTQDALWGPLQYDLGNKWVRVGPDNGSFTWNYVEHEKGKLEIDSRADEAITEAVRNGINVIMVLDFKGNWIYMEPPRKTNWLMARFREINNNYDDPPGVANVLSILTELSEWVSKWTKKCKSKDVRSLPALCGLYGQTFQRPRSLF